MWISRKELDRLKTRIDNLEDRQKIYDPFYVPPSIPIVTPGYPVSYAVPQRSVNEVLYKFFDDWKMLLNHLGISFVDVNCKQTRKIEVKEK